MLPRMPSAGPPTVTLDELQQLFVTSGFLIRVRSIWTLRAVHSEKYVIAEVEAEREYGYRVRLICVGRVYDFLPCNIHTAKYILGDALRWQELMDSGRSGEDESDPFNFSGRNGG